MQLCSTLALKNPDFVMQDNDQISSTKRLSISRLSFADAGFILKLLNKPSFMQFIADREVGTEEDARKYLAEGSLDGYDKNGFGLFRVSSVGTHESIGICGLVKRSELPQPDLGFAFLQTQWGNGYALEPSQAVLQYAASDLSLRCFIAIVNADNAASIRLLNKLGCNFEKMVRMTGETENVCQYTIAL
jgi:ribosomal-protein-alanine N-acetyltransferase